MLDLFTPDAVFHMNGKAVAKGTDELRRWHERFFAAGKDYRLSKTLRAAAGDVITVEFAERWVNSRDGQPRDGAALKPGGAELVRQSATGGYRRKAS